MSLRLSVRIRTNIATRARRKLAAPPRPKVVTHSHFKIPTLRNAGVQSEPVIDDALNSKASCRQHL